MTPFFVSRPDARLCVRRQPARTPHARPLMLLHGFPDFWIGWTALAAAMGPDAPELLIPDLRGFNDSEADAAGARFDLPALVEDVLAIADAVGAEQVDLMGHDWGGVIAWACAQVAPQRVSQLTVLNAPHPFALAQALHTDPEQQERSRYIAALQDAAAERRLPLNNYALLEAAFLTVAEAGCRGLAIQEAYRVAWSRPGRLAAMLAYYRAADFLTNGGADWRPPAPLSQPILMLWGGRDRAFAAGLPGAHQALAANLTLAILPEIGHWPHQEDPAAVARRWRAWRELID